jgi:glutamyl/glutaminyl-tRNA synthetase
MTVSELAAAMQRAGLLEDPAPPAAERWIATFIDAYTKTGSADSSSRAESRDSHNALTVDAAIREIELLRAEATIIPALELERLRNRQVVFFLDAVAQYVDAQEELRDLPLAGDIPAIADEFGIAHPDAFAAVRMALTGRKDGIPLEALFVLLGHERIMIRIGAVSSHLLHGRGLEPIAYGPGGVPFETIHGEKPPGA